MSVVIEERVKRFSYPDRQGTEGVDGVMTWPIRRLTDQGDLAVVGGVVVEEPLEIRLDGLPVAVLMRTPGLEKELAAGFCLGEGLVERPSDVALVRHCGRMLPDESAEGDPLDDSRNRVDVTLLPGARVAHERRDATPLIRSGCGRTTMVEVVRDLMPLPAGMTVRRAVLSHLPAQMARRQAAYRAAGGIHAAALFDTQGQAVVVCEDIGRHNAADKATGYCLLRGIPLHDKILVSTGRASYDMVVKAVRLGVPLVASVSSPTSAAVELAETLNCTLLGYLRGKTLNIYTHGWRIITASEGEEE